MIITKTNFTAGELTPLAAGRQDYQKYGNAVKRMKNCFPSVYGSALNRPGKRFISEVKDSSKYTRIVSFEFNELEAYILEFGEEYIRFYKNNERIIYEVATPYLEADLDKLYFAQSADVLLIAHSSYPPKKLSRFSDTNWTLEDVVLIDGPYQDIVDFFATLTPDSYSGTITMDSDIDIFNINMEGTILRWRDESENWYWFNIDDFVNSRQVWCTLRGSEGFDGDIDTLPSKEKSGPFRIGSFGQHSSYPGCISFYEQRLCFASTYTEPSTIWCSKTGALFNFSPTEDDSVTENSAVKIVGGEGVNVIKWLVAGRQLISGTESAIFGTGPINEALTPTNVNHKTALGLQGAQDTQAIHINGKTLFFGRQGKKLIELVYDFNTDSYKGVDLSILGEHLCRKGLKYIIYQEQPARQIYMLTDEGTMLSLLYYRDEEEIGWSEYETDGTYESIATIPGENRDIVWAVVNRTINGETKRYVELFEKHYGLIANEDIQTDAFFVDSGITYNYNGVNTDVTNTLEIIYDGWNTDNDKKLAINGGPPWTKGTILDLTASGAGFTPFSQDSIGDKYILELLTIELVVTITQYISSSQVKIVCDEDIPQNFQGLALSTWVLIYPLTMEATGFTPFSPSSLNDKYILRSGDDEIEVIVISYESSTKVTINKLSEDIPVSLLNTDISDWSLLSNEVTGLDHLENKEVFVVCNGSWYPNKTVLDGKVYLDNFLEEYTVHAGLPYICEIEFLPFLDQNIGSTIGKKQDIKKVSLSLYKTVGGKIGYDNQFVKIDVREPFFTMDEPVPPYTGEYNLSIPSGFKQPNNLKIIQDVPLPFCISAISVEIDTTKEIAL